ncbi:ABC transporter permease [uncultured Nonlabens sp.]|uniref:ABC transporter permease n=1 Tax=uncultured Nonlabens sp. TaxID=859306 RepID=UPI00260D7198|nr:ABC transporter permease [uncultured Nonlabens sp.]
MIEIKEIIQVAYSNFDKSKNSGITVAWGIFILILLTATGNGLQNGITKSLSQFTINSIDVYAGQISISSLGVTKGDYVDFNEVTTSQLKRNFNEIEYLSPVINVSGKQLSSDLNTTQRFTLYGVEHDYFKIKTLNLKHGRFYNYKDVNEHVIVVGHNIATSMFNNSNAVGRILIIDNRGYKVVGVLEEDNFMSNTGLHVFMPYEVAIALNENRNFDNFVLSMSQKTNTESFTKTLKTYLKKIKGIHSNDKTALYLDHPAAILETFNTVFKAINLFLWFIGISFLVSGMLSIYNVMTIIVTERTGEFGIRKSLGATPISIQKMVLYEALIITLLSGILGMILGYFVVLLINTYLSITSTNEFLELTISPYIVIFGILLLMISGSIAGIIPARKASNVLPVEALRALNN